jgi:hypothetical protein
VNRDSQSDCMQEKPMSTPVLNVTPAEPASCGACPRPAYFQARIDTPPPRGRTRQRANACASHLIEAMELLCAWSQAHDIAGGRLTVAAIDPYALPWMAARGIADYGFAFYSGPITRLDPAAQDVGTQRDEESRND